MEFTTLDASEFPAESFGAGRGKSALTVQAEELLVACAEAQEKQGVPGIQLHDVAENADGLKKFRNALTNAAEHMKVTVLIRDVAGKPYDLAIRVTERQGRGRAKATPKGDAPAVETATEPTPAPAKSATKKATATAKG